MKNGRLLSLDVLRGFNMLWLIGLGVALREFAALFPAHFSWLGVQMRHLAGGGDGFTFYDGIFPLFLFLTGVSFPFSYASQVKRGLSLREIHLRLFRRAALLVVLSFLQNGILQFSAAGYHYNSVLQRLGLTWLVSALVWMHFRPRSRLIIALALLVGYQVALSVWGYGCVDVLDSWFAPRGYFAHDPFEVHDLPLSVLQMPLCLLGMFAGEAVRVRSGARTAAGLAVAGAACVALGLLMHVCGLPINKNLATPANTLFFGGASCLLLALFHYLVDVRGWRTGTGFLRVIGVNSIAAYLMPTVLPLKATAAFFFGGFASLAGVAAPLVCAAGLLAVSWTVLWFLDRHGIHFKV